MKRYAPDNFKHYKIEASDGSVSMFGHPKDSGPQYSLEEIKKHLTYVDKETGKRVTPLKIKRVQ